MYRLVSHNDGKSDGNNGAVILSRMQPGASAPHSPIPPKTPRWESGTVITYDATPRGATAQRLRRIRADTAPEGAVAADPTSPEAEVEGQVSPRQQGSSGTPEEPTWWTTYFPAVQNHHLLLCRQRQPRDFPALLARAFREMGLEFDGGEPRAGM